MTSTLRLYFSRRWWWTTLFMLFSVGVMIRLGIWQLDRLAARRSENAHLLQVQSEPQLDINTLVEYDALTGMEYRAATASGTFDFDHQVALQNQYRGIQDGPAEYGYHLLTPLLLENGSAILVDRGWIPGSYDDTASWSAFDVPAGATVNGILRLSQQKAEMGGPSTEDLVPGERRDFWPLPDLEAIALQLPYPLLPVYLQQAPLEGNDDLPYPVLPELEISEGPHLGYAMQWFFYASLVFFGYPVYLRRRSAAD
jgi:surfeit locus 1 family protein